MIYQIVSSARLQVESFQRPIVHVPDSPLSHEGRTCLPCVFGYPDIIQYHDTPTLHIQHLLCTLERQNPNIPSASSNWRPSKLQCGEQPLWTKVGEFCFFIYPWMVFGWSLLYQISIFPLVYRKNSQIKSFSSSHPSFQLSPSAAVAGRCEQAYFQLKNPKKTTPPEKEELWTLNFVQVPISIPPLHPLAGKLVSWLIPLSLILFSYLCCRRPFRFSFSFFLRNPIPELAIGLNPTFVQFQSSFESLYLHRISGLSAGLALLNSDIYHIVLLVSGSQGSIPLTSGEGFWHRDFPWSITPELVIRREKREENRERKRKEKEEKNLMRKEQNRQTS